MDRRSFFAALAALALPLPAFAQPAHRTHGGRAIWTRDALRNPYADIAREGIDRILKDRAAPGCGDFYMPYIVNLRDPRFLVRTGPVWDAWSGWDPATPAVVLEIYDRGVKVGVMNTYHFRQRPPVTGAPERGLRKITDHLYDIEKRLPGQVELDLPFLKAA